MPKPVPGGNYVCGGEASFEDISIAAYGTPNEAQNIISSNKLKSLFPSPGLQIYIPYPSTYEATIIRQTGAGGPDPWDKELPEENPNKWAILIDGNPVNFRNMKYTRSMSNACIECSAELPWSRYDIKTPDGMKMFNLLKPYSYSPVKIYLGGYRMMTGFLFGVKNRISTDGIVKEIQMASPSANLIDSTMIPPYQYKGVGLRKIAEKVCGRFGIEVKWYAKNDEPFKRAACEAGDGCFDFLKKLAVQRGILIGCDEMGAMTFSDVDDSVHCGKIVEGQSAWTPGMEFDFDGRTRFSMYTATSKTGRRSSSATVKDLTVPFGRTTQVSAEDCHDGDIVKAAEWYRSKTIADGLSKSISVRGFIAPDGDYWIEGLTVDLYSDVMEIPQGYRFLVDTVTMSAGSGEESTELTLVPPGLYSGEPMENPWPRDAEEETQSWAQEAKIFKQEAAAEKKARIQKKRLAHRKMMDQYADCATGSTGFYDTQQMDDVERENFAEGEGMDVEDVAFETGQE